MVELLYPYTYLLALIGLLGWSLFPGRRQVNGLFRTLLFAGLACWGLSIFLAEASTPIKLLIVFRDLITMAIGGAIMHRARSNKIVGIALFLGIALMVKTAYLPILKSTFQAEALPLAADGELLIELGDVDVSELATALAKYKVAIDRAFHPEDGQMTDLDDYYTIDIPSDDPKTIRAVAALLRDSDLIDHLEENEVVSVVPMESTPTRSNPPASGFNDPDVGKQWAIDALDISGLHSLLTEAEAMRQKVPLLAILDTGVDAAHEDLTANYQSLNPSHDQDVRGHGTHVAGIAAAVSNNRIGIASLVPGQDQLRVTSVKVLSDMGFGSQTSIIKGMIYAADQGADVISMSLGSRSNDKKQTAYNKAVKYCRDKGAIVIAAAGNANMDATKYSPANSQGMIAVSAIDRNLARAPFSNHVQNIQWGLAAPGVDIYSTTPKNTYAALNGTSMAAPFVASVAALMKGFQPDLSTEEFYQLVWETGKDSKNTRATGAVVQPAAALSKLLASHTVPAL